MVNLLTWLSLKAANPEWNPTDPSGSIYLSRLADLNANSTYGAGPLPRRYGSLFAPGASRSFTPTPAPGLGFGATSVGGAVLSNEQRIAERAQIYDRALQKSQAVSVATPRGKTAGRTRTIIQPVVNEDEEDGGDVRSELGESYIDGTRPAGRGLDDGGAGMQGEIDELANGGVMGLLAQIYDGRRQIL